MTAGLSRAALQTLKTYLATVREGWREEIDNDDQLPQVRRVYAEGNIASLNVAILEVDALLTAQSSQQEEKLEAENAGLHALLAEVHAVSELPDDLQACVDAVLGATDPEGCCGNRLCHELMEIHQRADAADARVAALTGYVQHKRLCSVFLCVNCGFPKWLHDPTEDLDEVTCLQTGDRFIACTECTCKLASLLTPAPPGEPENMK